MILKNCIAATKLQAHFENYMVCFILFADTLRYSVKIVSKIFQILILDWFIKIDYISSFQIFDLVKR